MADHTHDLPGSPDSEPTAPVRRKVAWGTGAGFDEAAPPQRRADGPAPAPAFGDTFTPAPLAGEEEASDTAWLHSGLPAPSVPSVAAPQHDGAEDHAPAYPAYVSGASATADETVTSGTSSDSPVHGWVPPAPTTAGTTADLASVFDDMFDDGPQEAEAAVEAAAVADVPYPTPLVDAAPTTSTGEGLTAEAPGQVLLFPTDPAPAPEPAPGADESTHEPHAGQGLGDGSEHPPAPADQVPAAVTATTAEQDPSGTATSRRFDLAARRAALESARQVSTADFAAIGPDLQTLRYGPAADQLYNTVDRILGLGRGGDPELQAMIKRLELTRDKELDRKQRRDYQAMLEPRLATGQIQIATAADRDAIFDIAYDELLGIGPLGPLWRDDSVTEIMVSGPDKVTVERHGRLALTPVRFRNQAHLESTARTLAGISGDDRAVSAVNPLVTIQLPRARVQFVWRPLAVRKVAIAIRKFGDLMDMGQLLSYGSLSEEMAAFLHDAVTARATLLVSGGTGSGKTTFINAVSEFIPATERVITIEDALELQLRNTHVESLVTKEAASADDTMLFGQDQLLKASLRMRPDRIIVGEIRDGKGCAVMLEAANTGHDGTMTTIHANSPDLALQRMATLLRRVESMPDDVAKAEVGTAINVIVQVVRKRGRRFVSHISVVDPNAAVTGVGQLVTPLFAGEFPAAADQPVFRRVAGIRPDTELAIKMTDAGLDPAQWEWTS